MFVPAEAFVFAAVEYSRDAYRQRTDIRAGVALDVVTATGLAHVNSAWPSLRG